MTPSIARPGPQNALTDVPGLMVGCADDPRVRTGVTVIVPDAPAVCAVDVRGGGPGTRETDVLHLDALVETVDALVLSGGSAYGLAAADGVAAMLGAEGRGFVAVPGRKPVPITPAAILFDLANGGDKDWGATPPYADLGRAAYAARAAQTPLGTVGAGFGAMAGALKGGQGTASLAFPDGGVVAALAAVNCVGSAVMPGSRAFWAYPFEIDAEFGGVTPFPGWRLPDPLAWGFARPELAGAARANTTIAAVATDFALTAAEARRVAIMAQDGLARAIRPVHAPADGDAVFVLSVGRRALPEPRPAAVTLLGAAAADTLSRAVARGVFAATPIDGERCWRDLGAPR